MVLIPSVVNTVNIPVIAAGGIANGNTMAAAFALGASGVQCGSAFLATEECPIPDAYKQKVIETIETETVVTGTNLGHPVRSIRNTLTDTYLQMEKEGASEDELEKLTEGSLYKAAKLGDIDYGSMMCGQSAALVHEIRSSKTVIETMVKDAKNIIHNLSL